MVDSGVSADGTRLYAGLSGQEHYASVTSYNNLRGNADMERVRRSRKEEGRVPRMKRGLKKIMVIIHGEFRKPGQFLPDIVTKGLMPPLIE
jgi:hypothetical protein